MKKQWKSFSKILFLLTSNSKFGKMRKGQKLPHTLGRNAFSRTAHEMRKKNPGLKGLRTRVWMHGHLRNDGKPINEAVTATLAHKRIEDCAQSISDTPAENSIHDDGVARILGPEHRERVRGLGFVVSPSKVDGQFKLMGE
ncbi:uncharacterized protein LOC111395557 [Olea europaea var. sylvestris]|uniref:uncharacterized protein LOC111395557 n=1 Tax=Olea europaea var. sylvestris TaxID=158386 RepID=UPI000C1D2D83|nr:uncharacterized protein LOC111395557 [Olea europaea var. sylvestris]